MRIAVDSNVHMRVGTRGRLRLWVCWAAYQGCCSCGGNNRTTLATTFPFRHRQCTYQKTDPHANITARSLSFGRATAHTHPATFRSQLCPDKHKHSRKKPSPNAVTLATTFPGKMAVRGVQKNTDLSKLAVQSEDTTHPCPRHLIPSTLDVANKEQPSTNQKLEREKQKSKNRKRAKQLLAPLSRRSSN
jgi:hypothetical protein